MRIDEVRAGAHVATGAHVAEQGWAWNGTWFARVLNEGARTHTHTRSLSVGSAGTWQSKRDGAGRHWRHGAAPGDPGPERHAPLI